MSHIRIQALGANAFRNATAQLSNGLWVVLSHRDDAGSQFARILAGVQKPSSGQLLFGSQQPYRSPSARGSTAAVLPDETYQFTSTVQRAIESVSRYRGLNLAPEVILKRLDIEHLLSRSTTTLTQREARLVSMAIALSQRDVRFAVVHEPLLILDGSQLPRFQDWLSEVTPRACVVCITSSSHDARILGGPQAQLTMRGWEPTVLHTPDSALRSVFVQGVNIGGLAAAVALETRCRELVLETTAREHSLRVTGFASDVSAKKIATMARSTGATVLRLWTKLESSTDIGEEPSQEAPAEPVSEQRDRLPRGATLTSVLDQMRLLLRPVLTPIGVAGLALQPALAWLYGASSDRSFRSYETLVFTATILTPLWSIWVARLLSSNTAANDPNTIGRFGICRRIPAVSRAFVGSALTALASALAGLLGTLGASNWRAIAPAVSELYQSSWILGLAGAAYGSAISILSTFKRRWFWCWALVLLDLVLGGTNHGTAFPFPRAHIHNLLGSPSSIQLSQQGSCAYLACLVVLAIGLTWVRTEP